MNEFPKKDYIMELIEEAVGRASKLGKVYECRLSGDFMQAHKTLEASVELLSQTALILTAARMNITHVEKKTIALIVGDDPITGLQMSHLVRIRLICSELINLLSTILETNKQSLGRPGANLSGAR